ncbi:glycosyltransferase family 1 protein [Conidiobolus coronatus NRRL 28638]|uniref:Glycosyltransferase family 1 protein n=1 Tax=Conidiobolus coronatus (strain ATCC 28846 / CBS 209.66 / NRRL 28638) TaxID=796925 RepID=A0A137P0W7_CONC2|nr:glycosyltransferase family 1 protein [Conidiobolus coronatus NRRL 28638]|eukprot:KXN68642.1 glycosyltransferase family 1 protein [Conidiobolus coronatus NRRL 28638]
MKLNKILNLTLLAGYTAETTSQKANELLNIAVSVTLGSRSHAKYLFEITELLVSRGHTINYLCTEGTLKYSKGYNVSNTIVSEAGFDLSKVDMKPFTRNSNPIGALGNLGKLIKHVYTESFPNYENYYKEQKPDLIICDFGSPSCIDSAAKFSIPLIIGYQSLSFAERKPYLTTSNGFEPTTIEKYSFWERFSHGIIQPGRSIINQYSFLNELKQARKENGVPASISMVQFTNMGLGIANSYIGFENPRSLSSHVYTIGPILPDTVPTLSDDLQPFFDSHKKILYIAFGSLVRFKKDISTNMLEHFQRLLNDGWIDGIVWGGMANTNSMEFPKTYIVNNVEYPTESILDGTHEQFKLLKWAPQDAILNHSHTKLFMTHGGLDSIYEAIQSGTPMLAVPYFGDQPRNAALIKEHGIGDYIEWPLDGDDLINQKFVNILDPSNKELKANLEQFKGISKFSSNRKLFAADLIETYANSAKICRRSHTPKSYEIPCEVKPFLPLDQQISTIKANLIDVYLVAIIFTLTITGLITFLSVRPLYKLYTSYNKQKID